MDELPDNAPVDFRRSAHPRNLRKTLRDRDRQVIRRIVLGEDNEEIAHELGVSACSISRLRRSPVGRQAIEEMHERLDAETVQIAARIRAFAPECLDLIEAVIRGQHPDVSTRVRVEQAGRHLARAGFGEIRKERSMQLQLTRAEIEQIKARSRAASHEWDALEADQQKTG